jgi:hypothetical protein
MNVPGIAANVDGNYDFSIGIVGLLAVVAVVNITISSLLTSGDAPFKLYTKFDHKMWIVRWAYPVGYWESASTRQKYGGVFDMCEKRFSPFALLPILMSCLYIVATFFITAALVLLAPVLIFVVSAAQAVYEAASWFIERRWILELPVVEQEEERRQASATVTPPRNDADIDKSIVKYWAGWITKAQQEEVVQLNVFGDPVVVLKNTSIDSVDELDTSEEKCDSQHRSLSVIRPIGIGGGVSSYTQSVISRSGLMMSTSPQSRTPRRAVMRKEMEGIDSDFKLPLPSRRAASAMPKNAKWKTSIDLDVFI